VRDGLLNNTIPLALPIPFRIYWDLNSPKISIFFDNRPFTN